MNHTDIFFCPAPSFNQYRDTSYFNNESRFNGVFPRDNLSRMKNGAYMIKLYDKQSKGTHWISLFIDKIRLCTLILLGFNIFHTKY